MYVILLHTYKKNALLDRTKCNWGIYSDFPTNTHVEQNIRIPAGKL